MQTVKQVLRKPRITQVLQRIHALRSCQGYIGSVKAVDVGLCTPSP